MTANDEYIEQLDPIQFFVEEVEYEVEHPTLLRQWLYQVAATERSEAIIDGLTYIICSDEYLYQINMEYLEHDTYTDVITFPYSDDPYLVEGDVFISIERVTENAAELGLHPTDELHRIMVHGLLHLLGYDDKTPEAKTAMTAREDYHLQQRPAALLPIIA